MSLASRTFAALLLSVSFPSALAARSVPPPTDAALARAIDAYVQPMVARGDLSGQLLVLRRGRTVAERNFGFANLELRAPVTAETRFNIASVTKPMTGVLAIQQIVAGRMSASDSIARWFPDFPKGDSITVSMLLRHRSGIPHELFPDSAMTRPISAAEDVERAKRLPLDFSPGARESYSSGGYEVLARVLERVSGRSYADLAADSIFKPLAMAHTGHVDSRRLVPGRASGYVPEPRGIENAPLEDFSALVGAGSVWSTARDLDRFVRAVVSGHLGEGPRLSYVRGGRLDFNGRTGGFKAWATWDSLSGIEAILVSNVASGAPDELKRAIPRLASGESVSPPAPPALGARVVPPDELRRWEGVYQIEHGPRLEVRVRDGALYCNDWVLLPAADGTFYSPRDYGRVRGVAGAGGRLARLDWTQGDQVYSAPRVGD
jgi:CubicO group peptidase (beta-lactamase class C family)